MSIDKRKYGDLKPSVTPFGIGPMAEFLIDNKDGIRTFQMPDGSLYREGTMTAEQIFEHFGIDVTKPREGPHGE